MITTKDMRNGLHVTFSNGLTLSVQWHGGNYCDNRNEGYETDNPSSNVEIAVWDRKENWMTKAVLGASDVVVGWVSMDELADVFGKVAHYGEEE